MLQIENGENNLIWLPFRFISLWTENGRRPFSLFIESEWIFIILSTSNTRVHYCRTGREAVFIGWDPTTHPLPPKLGSCTRELLVSQDRRHLFGPLSIPLRPFQIFSNILEDTVYLRINVHRCQRHRRKIYRRRLREFAKKFETVLMGYSGTRWKLIHKKNLMLKILCQTPFTVTRSFFWYLYNFTCTIYGEISCVFFLISDDANIKMSSCI